MDFSGRSNNQPSPAAPRPGTAFSADGGNNSVKSGGGKKDKESRNFGKWSKYTVGGALIVFALLAAAVLGVLLTAKNNTESRFVDSSKYQAVFLTNDQVYFGKISEVNGKYLVLNNIYYLQTSSTDATKTTSNNVSLVKLGCELHKPYDTMVVNRAEVQFWENLQSDGQVATAVKQFQTQNPKGQTCSNSASNSTNVQGSAAPSTTPATTNTNSSTGN